MLTSNVRRLKSRAARSVPPAASTILPAHAPTFGGNEWRYLQECLDTGWVSSAGPFVPRLERAFAAYSGAAHAVATINGTAALHVALRVIGLAPDEEVLLPDLTFIASASAVRYCGAYPVLLDVERRSWQLDADKLAAFLRAECVMRRGHCINRRSGRTIRAIIPVHLVGLACEIDRIVDLAHRHHLAVVEDAAQAVGVRYRGQSVGTFGDIGVFSFNGNKIITAGGGGMLVTNEPQYAEHARRLTTHARDDEHLGQSGKDEIGFNYRLNNLQAAVGLAQLEQLDVFIARKRRIAARYAGAFAALDRVVPMPITEHTDSNFWQYTIQLAGRMTAASRDVLIRALNDRGIGARPLWRPLHRLAPFRRAQRYRITQAPRLYARSICLPSSADLDDRDIDRCIRAIAEHLKS